MRSIVLRLQMRHARLLHGCVCVCVAQFQFSAIHFSFFVFFDRTKRIGLLPCASHVHCLCTKLMGLVFLHELVRVGPYHYTRNSIRLTLGTTSWAITKCGNWYKYFANKWERDRKHIHSHSIFSVPNRHGQGMTGMKRGRRGREGGWEQRIPFHMPQTLFTSISIEEMGFSFAEKQRRRRKMSENTKNVYCMAMAQCIEAMRNTYVRYVRAHDWCNFIFILRLVSSFNVGWWPDRVLSLAKIRKMIKWNFAERNMRLQFNLNYI